MSLHMLALFIYCVSLDTMYCLHDYEQVPSVIQHLVDIVSDLQMFALLPAYQFCVSEKL